MFSCEFCEISKNTFWQNTSGRLFLDIKTYKSMQISRCSEDKTKVSGNFKRNLHHFNMKKVEHVQLFHTKMKED